MTKHHAVEQDSIVAEIEVAAPIERVFQAISSAEQLNIWFTDACCPVKLWEMDARKGGRWKFASSAGTKAMNGVTEFRSGGEILEIDPPRLLVYSWHANWHDDPSLATVVRWELTPGGQGTKSRTVV